MVEPWMEMFLKNTTLRSILTSAPEVAPQVITCGATSGADVKMDLKVVFFKNISIHGSTMGSKADLITLVRLVHEGKLKAVIDSTYSMADLPKAYSHLEARAAFG